MTLDVVTPSSHCRVLLTCLRILIAIKPWIEFIFLALWLHSLEQLQRILTDGLLVEAHPAQHGTIGSEAESTVVLKLLLVNPVRNTVNDFVATTILRHLTLSIVIEQFHEEKVIVAHESDLCTVGTPQGHLLFIAVRKAFQLPTLDGIDIVVGLERTAIDGFCISAYKHTATIRRHVVTVEVFYLLSLCLIDIEEHPRLLSRLERILHDAPPITRDTGIAVSALYRVDAIDTLGSKLASTDCLQRKLFGSKQTHGCQHSCTDDNKNFSHTRLILAFSFIVIYDVQR